MLTLRIETNLLNRYPQLRVGAFCVEGLAHAAGRVTTGQLAELWMQTVAELTRIGTTSDKVADVPVVAEWRRAIAACGLKPSTYKSSVEALVRRVLKDGAVSTPLPIVTAYCAISARTLAPMGGYDMSRLPVASVDVRCGRPERDTFTPLGGRAEDMPITRDVALYASGNTVMCWAFNHRDSKATCLQDSTDRAVFFCESIAELQYGPMQQSLQMMNDLLSELGATVGAVAFVDRDTHSASVTVHLGDESRAVFE